MTLVVVDTSVWVEAFRRRGDPATRASRRALLDEERAILPAPSRIELLGGGTPAWLETLRRALGAVPSWRPGDATWARAESWVELAVGRGERLGVVDLLIGALAAEHAAPVWSLDRDFERLEALGLVARYQPGSS